MLRQSDIGGLIVQRRMLGNDYAERLLEALPELRDGDGGALYCGRAPFLRWIVSSGPDLPAGIADISYLTDVADTISEALLLEIESEVHPTDQMVEIYTSGSMALPKGVKHLHGPVMRRARYIASMGGPQTGRRSYRLFADVLGRRHGAVAAAELGGGSHNKLH